MYNWECNLYFEKNVLWEGLFFSSITLLVILRTLSNGPVVSL